MIKPNQIISLSIDNLGSSGEGVGSYQGLRVFVDGALPSESIVVKITVSKKNYAKGMLEKILVASANRVKAPCPYFDRCGGCQIMHLDYQTQLELKRQRVIDAFERIGGFKGIKVEPCVASPSPFGYRNKIQLPVKGVRGDLKIGLFERGSHDLVDIEACLIHCELGESIFRHVRQLLKGSDIVPYCTRTGKGELRHVLIKSAVVNRKALVVFVTNGPASKSLKMLAERLFHDLPLVKGIVQNINRQRSNVILGKTYKTLIGDSVIEETICGLTFKISPASFFQVNVSQAEHLYRYVVESLGDSETVIDAYCGVGTLSLLLAQRAGKVIGIESVPEAIQDAKENAKANGVSNVEFYCEFVERALDQLAKGDVVVLNPPRKGCELEVIEAIDQSRIIYVSCDPATCARDLSRLKGYEIVSVQPFDMFPQTAHVETVVMLSKDPQRVEGLK